MNIWALCRGEQFINTISAEPWRVVENQHVLSSRDLVDSIEEHELLEELIESSKPAVAQEKSYLIFTPFRYPPLNYGSRFGNIFEPSLWYGSLEIQTAFSEVAYYRLKFFDDSHADLGSVEISMTAFSTSLISRRGIDLTDVPFKQYAPEISNRNSYEHSQLLGTKMREQSVALFLYYSARVASLQINVAAFNSSVFRARRNKYIHQQQNWKCYTTKEKVEFVRMDFIGKKQFSFSADYFKELSSLPFTS